MANFKSAVLFLKITSFSCNNDRLILWITEKIEVSFAKCLVVDDRFLNISLICTKNNTGQKIDPWGMPASTCDNEDDWPFNKILWSLFNMKLSLHFSGRPDIPTDCSLEIRPSCQTQSNALDMSNI